ncbi:phage capsid protein [Vagococcus carniphilus]|uniref:phage capsid protein n=1 Tax=Vagococcus carniphilus TaxID=218144 RepID=UPI002891AB4C|nr:phage capsid protein [Vagococcus carniphilus]MDT2830026.1 phage capsid protein [Vagococcus carniphilus]MDT2838461.1 phage capsid protein [Vagococcus carniphilus]MDT2855622.1 phage capsid protein [Vagococcus carniphilus]
MAEQNINVRDDFGAIQKLDYVLQFERNIKQFLEALGVVNLIPLAQDQQLRTYTWEVDLANGNVAEGEIIPLSKATRKPKDLIEVPLEKYRRAVTVEAVRRHGLEIAKRLATEKITNEIQYGLQADFIDFLQQAATKKGATNLQQALALGWGYSKEQFKNMGVTDYVTFINHMDLAEFLGNAPFPSGTKTDFGFTILKDFLGTGTVIVYDDCPKGKTYTTAVNNIGLAFQMINGSEMGSEFELVSDATGFIGIAEGGVKTDNATKEHLFLTGTKLFVEIPEAVVEMTITPATPEGDGTRSFAARAIEPGSFANELAEGIRLGLEIKNESVEAAAEQVVETIEKEATAEKAKETKKADTKPTTEDEVQTPPKK